MDLEKEQVSGNSCPRGKEYGIKELTAPTRMVTTTVAIEGAIHPRLPVKTASPIPKEKIMALMDAVSGIKIQSPVSVGTVIVENILDTGVDIVACRSM